MTVPYADEFSVLCGPPSPDSPDENDPRHAECEAQLTDFSDLGKQWAYCACDCHHKPDLPGFREHTAGRYVTWMEVLIAELKQQADAEEGEPDAGELP